MFFDDRIHLSEHDGESKNLSIQKGGALNYKRPWNSIFTNVGKIY